MRVPWLDDEKGRTVWKALLDDDCLLLVCGEWFGSKNRSKKKNNRQPLCVSVGERAREKLDGRQHASICASLSNDSVPYRCDDLSREWWELLIVYPCHKFQCWRMGDDLWWFTWAHEQRPQKTTNSRGEMCPQKITHTHKQHKIQNHNHQWVCDFVLLKNKMEMNQEYGALWIGICCVTS